MMAKAEILKWVNALPDEAQIGIDEGGLHLIVDESEDYLEVGGMPEEDGDDD
jgi:hypothetical protein